MRASTVAQVFLEDQGQAPRQLFAEWNPQPFAAASIGQVHRARLLGGQEIAVKVQYPGIAAAMQADVLSADLLDRLGTLIFRGQERRVLIDELRERLAEECNYLIEAQYQEEFRALFKARPGLRIPQVRLEHTSQRILVSDLADGESFESFMRHASQAERNRAGALIFGFFVESFCRHGVFNADPHPGNYLFSDGDVVLVDFGCVKRMKAHQVALWRRILRAYLERRFEVARELVIQMGTVPQPDGFDFEYHHRMVLSTYEFSLRAAPFRFDADFMRRMLRVRGRDNPGKFRVNVPKDWIFANRMVLGLFALLARLEATADFRGMLLEVLYEPGEARPEAYTEAELLPLIGRRG